MTKTITYEMLAEWMADNGITEKTISLPRNQLLFQRWRDSLPDDPVRDVSREYVKPRLRDIEAIIGREEMDRAIAEIQKRGESLESLFSDTERIGRTRG
jgi:hypothetical protein